MCAHTCIYVYVYLVLHNRVEVFAANDALFIEPFFLFFGDAEISAANTAHIYGDSILPIFFMYMSAEGLIP